MRELRKGLESIDNENSIQNLWDSAKAVLREFTALPMSENKSLKLVV